MATDRHQPAESPNFSQSAADPLHEADEVDVSLIRWMLSLTPTERLVVLQNHIKALNALKAAVDAG